MHPKSLELGHLMNLQLDFDAKGIINQVFGLYVH